MNKVTFVEITDPLTNEIKEYAIIDRGNGEFTSMPKATYDEQQAHLTESVQTNTTTEGSN